MEELKVYIQQEVQKLTFSKVDFDESLIKSKLLDSIAFVDLIVSIEEYTNKKIPQYLIIEENFDTITKITETLGKI